MGSRPHLPDDLGSLRYDTGIERERYRPLHLRRAAAENIATRRAWARVNMRRLNRASRKLIAGMMLLAFAVRALIPPGFMPATDRPFSIEICWEGLPAQMLAHGGPAGHADSMDMGSMSSGSMSSDSMRADPVRASTHESHPPGGQHHSGGSPHSEHCVFGTACSAGPIPHLPLPSDISSTEQLLAVDFVSVAGTVRLVHLPPPRAPPGRLT
jgi:hypothetical protein